MTRWIAWFLLAPQAYLVAGVWRDCGLPAFDVGVLWCLFLAFFAERRALPWLLLGVALGRALVDDASLALQVLVLGVPVAAMLPLRLLLHGQRWPQLALAAAGVALTLPRLAGLLGGWFAQPSASAQSDWLVVLWTAVFAPPLLALARRLPPCRGFVEAA
ncbi:MAG: hypothetical protein ACK6D1_02855 [Planctomycetota bacterium]